jgi:hypothetical protein
MMLENFCISSPNGTGGIRSVLRTLFLEPERCSWTFLNLIWRRSFRRRPSSRKSGMRFLSSSLSPEPPSFVPSLRWHINSWPAS